MLFKCQYESHFASKYDLLPQFDGAVIHGLRIVLDTRTSLEEHVSAPTSTETRRALDTLSDEIGHREGWGPKIKMTNIQAFVLGIMMAWTPSMIVAAVLLLRAPDNDDFDSARGSPRGAGEALATGLPGGENGP